MLNLVPLTSLEQLSQIKDMSKDVPVLIFKHSTRCGISSSALSRLERNWKDDFNIAQVFYVDVLKSRPVSTSIAELFNVHHESPQLLFIFNSQCLHHTSHSGISADIVHEWIESYPPKNN